MYGNVISVWGVTDTLFQSSQIFMIAQKLRAEISRIGARKVGLLGYTKYKLRSLRLHLSYLSSALLYQSQEKRCIHPQKYYHLKLKF